MAARTASVSGLWSNTATWGGSAVPVDGDTITINTGIIVEFDVDQSGFATGLGAQAINGTLKVTNTAGTYYWKCAGTVTFGASSSYLANNGSIGGLLPANVKFTQALNGNFSNAFPSTAIVDINCQEPTHKYAKVTVAASAAATVLTIDTNLTGGGADALWANPSLVRIDDINQAQESEQYTISSLSSTQITLTSGLTNAKSIGAYVILLSRNIEIIQLVSVNGIGFNACGSATNPVSIAASMRNLTAAIASVQNGTIGGVMAGCTTGNSTGFANTLNGVVTGGTNANNACQATILNGLISGCNTGLVNCQVTIVNGIITGCANGLNQCSGSLVTGSLINSGNGLFNCPGTTLQNATLNNNNRDLSNAMTGQAFNTLFGSAVEFNAYNSVASQVYDYFESIDHDQVAGAFRAWTHGGIVNSIASPAFDASRVRSYQHVPENTSFPVFRQQLIVVPEGATLYVRCYVQKDASMSYLPRLWVFSADKEPLITGSPDSEIIMTNSTNTWEILETTVTNTTNGDKMYKVRTIAKNASGNVYFDPIIRLSSFQINKDMVGGLVA